MFRHGPILASFVLCCGLLGSATADELDESALAIAPSDAAFFSTSLNMREAWQEFKDGPFVKRLRAVNFVQDVEAEFWTQWENPQGQLAQAKAAMQSPNVKNLIKLAEEMFSDEAFVYGGDDWCQMIEGMMSFQQEMMRSIQTNPDQGFEEFVEELTKDDIDKLRVPTTVMGFRIVDEDNAKLQLDALEGLLRFGLGQVEEMKPLVQRLKRSDLDDGQTLSLTLDTSLIPEELLEGPDAEVGQRVLQLLEGRSLSMALGVRNGILLVVFGEGPSIIDSVGSSSSKLLEVDALQTLKDAQPERLRSIGYASERWMQAQWDANFRNYFSNLANQFTAAIEAEAGDRPEIQQWKEEILKDAAWLDEQVYSAGTEFGPVLSWSQAVEGGTEGFAYNWSPSLFENGTPLEILDHAGESPLLMVAMKQRSIPGLEKVCQYLFERGKTHLDRFIDLAEQDAEERDQVHQVVDQVWPLAEDAYNILANKIGPSLEDNESLFAGAASWAINQLPDLPPSQKPLPLPEMAIACRLADRELFLEGCDDMYGVFDEIVNLIREMEPDAIPAGYTVPRPIESDAGLGATKFTYSELSEAVPLPGFAPQLVVSDEVLIVGYSDRQVQSMLESRDLTARPAWVTPESPVAAVSYVDLAGMFASVRPWAEYGLSMTGMPLDAPLSDQPGPIPTGNDLLQIWDCLQALGKVAASTTVTEEGVTVSHWIWLGE